MIFVMETSQVIVIPFQKWENPCLTFPLLKVVIFDYTLITILLFDYLFILNSELRELLAGGLIRFK